MTDIEALWEAVRKFPNEDAPFQMLVDELIERGDERAASVLRWGASVPWAVKLVKRPKAVKLVKRPKLVSRPFRVTDWANVPEVSFDCVTEAVAEMTLTSLQMAVSRLQHGDRLLVRANRFAFVAAIDRVEEQQDSLPLRYVVRAKSVGEVEAGPPPGKQ